MNKYVIYTKDYKRENGVDVVGRLQGNVYLVGQPFAPVPATDYSAVTEAFLQDGVLHHGIVPVGVNPDRGIVLQCKPHHS